MKTDRMLLRILESTEKQLLEVIAKAATEGDLTAVDKARSVAGQIRRMTTDITSRESHTLVTNSKEPKNGKAKAQIVNEISSEKNYPEFSVRNGTLYRVAWSKKKQNEYEHRVPKQTVDLVANSMAIFANSDRRPIEVERIVANVNKSSIIQIPQYQVYLVVSWLRHQNCIEQVGRDGYRIPVDIQRLIENEWKLLLSKQE